PGPGYGDIPPFAISEEPCPAPVLPDPPLSPKVLAPGPSPWPIPDPPPEPPIPGLSPPPGDIARDPVPAVPGIPTFDPGSLDTTIPLPFPTPPPSGGATAEPTSSGRPKPFPWLPKPRPPIDVPPPTLGGGGTTPAPPEDPLPPNIPATACRKLENN